MMVQLGLITAKTGGYKNPLIYTSKYKMQEWREFSGYIAKLINEKGL